MYGAKGSNNVLGMVQGGVYQKTERIISKESANKIFRGNIPAAMVWDQGGLFCYDLGKDVRVVFIPAKETR